VVKEHKQRLRTSESSIHGEDNVNQKREEDFMEPPVNVKAYELFTKGLTPLQVATELKISEEDTTRYYTQYLRLKKLPNLGYLLERLRVPEKISAFIELTDLARAEHFRASQVLQLLKMANSPGMYNIEQNIKKYRWTIAHLRKTRQQDGLEHMDLNRKISSANGMLKQVNLAVKEKKEELATILDKKIMYGRMVEQFIANNNDIYLKIQTIAKDKVNAFLTEYNGRKLLEFAIAAVAEALRQDPQRELLIKQIPPVKNYDYDPEKVFCPNPYDCSYPNVTEKVVGLSSEMYDKLVKGLTDVTISTAAGLERYSSPNNTNFV
jgi:hypothetical protein